jgi:MFS family permease
VMSSLGLALLVFAFACTPFVHTPLTVAGVMVLFAIGSAFATNGITAMISNAASDREQGTILGVGSSLDSLSGILAPPFSTGVLTRYGSPYAGVTSLVMSTIALILGLRNSFIAPTVAPVTPEPQKAPVEELEAS